MEMNSGMQRATKVDIRKMSGDQLIYTHTYNILDSFSSYPAIDSSFFAKMSITDYKARMSAFTAYIESKEIGLSLDESGSYIENKTACPI